MIIIVLQYRRYLRLKFVSRLLTKNLPRYTLFDQYFFICFVVVSSIAWPVCHTVLVSFIVVVTWTVIICPQNIQAAKKNVKNIHIFGTTWYYFMWPVWNIRLWGSTSNSTAFVWKMWMKTKLLMFHSKPLLKLRVVQRGDFQETVFKLNGS